MSRETGSRRWGVLCILLVAHAMFSGSVVAQGVESWSAGMYWTYDATTSWVQTDSGKITLLVLGRAPALSSDAWLVAGVRDWWSGGEMVVPIWILEPRANYVRWPILASLLPKVESLTLYSALARQAALVPLVPSAAPFRIETLGYRSNASYPAAVTPPDWFGKDPAPWEAIETLTLVPEVAAELTLPSGSFSGALPVRYEWTNSGDADSGVGWWLPDLLAWGHVEGREEMYGIAAGVRTYAISLSEWGVMTEADMMDRVRLALERMEPFDREQAEDFRALLARLDFGR